MVVITRLPLLAAEHDRRMYANKEFVILWGRLFDVLDLDNIRGPESGTDSGFHKQKDPRAALARFFHPGTLTRLSVPLAQAGHFTY
jgi:hypothetical protein